MILLMPKKIAPNAAQSAITVNPKIGFPIIASEARIINMPKINITTQPAPSAIFLSPTDITIIEIPSNKKPIPQITHRNDNAKTGLVRSAKPARITKMCNASFRPHRLIYFLSAMVVITPPIPEIRKYTPAIIVIVVIARAKLPKNAIPTSAANIPTTRYIHHPLLAFPIFSAILSSFQLPLFYF